VRHDRGGRGGWPPPHRPTPCLAVAALPRDGVWPLVVRK